VSHAYEAVGWNGQKKSYDYALLGGVTLYLLFFVGASAVLHPTATAETLLIRGIGSAAFILLTGILCIGPLCRLDRRFLPFLYNRRHLGVTMFSLALAHGGFALFQFHALGKVSPLISLLTTNQDFGSLADFPFQPLGLLALIILFAMAATSHDFWLRNLTPPVWKSLHMSVYAAYTLLIAHVTLGLLQTERSPVLSIALAASVACVVSLHVAAAFAERRVDESSVTPERDGFILVGAVASIPENRAAVISARGERIAVYRYEGRISALSNVCRHQNGPLGEGRIIDGCVTCPWHGYQYLPGTGASPPPFTEKVATFRTKVVDGQVWIDPRPLPPGTPVEPSTVS
jgi:nitrite reductase/ring-hydroxylating ferredoxin subunit/DMSO/TMAO reductase YedYZ heme-binding membrane subunit